MHGRHTIRLPATILPATAGAGVRSWNRVVIWAQHGAPVYRTGWLPWPADIKAFPGHLATQTGGTTRKNTPSRPSIPRPTPTSKPATHPAGRP